MEYKNSKVIEKLAKAEPVAWVNPKLCKFEDAILPVRLEEMNEAEERLERFKPFIMKCFPETVSQGGEIESALTAIPNMQARINEKYVGTASKVGDGLVTKALGIPGRLLLKQDSHLAVAGSIKARGGIYEVLKHTEDLALENGLLVPEDSYDKLASKECRNFFNQYTIQVGSTGNLGLSIGITSAAIGYQVVVHMSADARQWKKDMLRSHGVKVVEYESDYSEAVKIGRKESDENPKSYFVDDENSKNLFLGYAVAAKRLKKQLDEQAVIIDENHPMFVYLPCGVGGAPGGVTFGLKQIFGDNVHCFFVEPVQAPCMILGMESGLHNEICVQDIGLTGLTHADGLAVGRASGFVGKVMEPLLSGEFTMEDKWLYEYMRDLLETEKIFLEPSACAAFEGPIKLMQSEEMRKYLRAHDLENKMDNAVHIAWATGGRLVPEEIREEYKKTVL